MLPLRDTTPCRTYPVVNTALIACNVLLYVVELGQGAGLNRFLYTYGLVPARYAVEPIAGYFTTGQQLFALVSFMFLHGGFLHLLGNMWSLYIFGDNIEDRLGPVRYLLFYLLCGLTSGITHMVLNLDSNVPVIGASGAIAGVMGAYFILYPNAKILTLIPIFFLPYFIEIPAYVFLGFWFFLQFISAAGSSGASGIAWWAHVGGFIFGIIFLKAFLALPAWGATAWIRRHTEKKTSPRLHFVRASGPYDDAHLYGTVTITPFEAFAGTSKVINIPQGLQKRLFRVTVPAGIAEGTVLRLKGLGRQLPDGRRGDVMLKVYVQPDLR